MNMNTEKIRIQYLNSMQQLCNIKQIHEPKKEWIELA